MSAAAGSRGHNGAIGGRPPAAATTMCQSSMSSTISGPDHQDRDRNWEVVRSAGGSLFWSRTASPFTDSSNVAALRLIAPADSR